MKTPYTKHFTSPQDLVLLLKNRGLEIKNEEKATAYIANIGYYRLSSYFSIAKSHHYVNYERYSEFFTWKICIKTTFELTLQNEYREANSFS